MINRHRDAVAVQKHSVLERTHGSSKGELFADAGFAGAAASTSMGSVSATILLSVPCPDVEVLNGGRATPDACMAHR